MSITRNQINKPKVLDVKKQLNCRQVSTKYKWNRKSRVLKSLSSLNCNLRLSDKSLPQQLKRLKENSMTVTVGQRQLMEAHETHWPQMQRQWINQLSAAYLTYWASVRMSSLRTKAASLSPANILAICFTLQVNVKQRMIASTLKI